MDKIEKFLRKLNEKEYLAFLFLFEQMKVDFREIPGIKKLIGYSDLYRIRLGRYRVIIREIAQRKVEIIKISKRDEGTYKL